eukprot:gnl/MRDRNA2_/MRDRNA2_453188_c0_seq1.p1 gnl/MRDRNA2_/MRDRNA2_453188_c0~~gnl/MRDRNA2_/MRDRNA2_453188_c0_seq1.p1  ORF type:complete len:116 (+),score=16.52 gnl/MRDRNA2_/MRDRNA2_453188_c0_seq1:170-517(+)
MVPGAAALIVVGSRKEMHGLKLEYADGGELSYELKNQCIDVHKQSFAKRLAEFARHERGDVDARGLSKDGGFVVTHRSGKVIISSSSQISLPTWTFQCATPRHTTLERCRRCINA